MKGLPKKSVVYEHPDGPGAIYQGGATAVEDAREFDIVVLCADEFQPDKKLFVNCPRVMVLHAPFDDAQHLTDDEKHRAVRAAKRVAVAVLEGKKVLVTCMQGRNRSGLVSALAITALTGISGRDAMQRVQASRPWSLTNPYFQRLLCRVRSRR